MVETIVKVISILLGLIAQAHAQAAAPGTGVVQFGSPTVACLDPANCAAESAVGWICANQTLVTAALGFLLAHGGLSIASAIFKKLGVTGDNNWVVAMIRVLAIDLKPPPVTVVAQAQKIVQANPAVAIEATQINAAQAATGGSKP